MCQPIARGAPDGGSAQGSIYLPADCHFLGIGRLIYILVLISNTRLRCNLAILKAKTHVILRNELFLVRLCLWGSYTLVAQFIGIFKVFVAN